ncbi:hypothetical protein D623_10017800 [Myotis brandtii]|uniref:Uncharacterized protein n=1 Tax=Myotis brandtii TaxID=109478 RepID=S7NJ45_MYOBR|nr:hypothetical protein D623_10017800 [Myotis brandtii]
MWLACCYRGAWDSPLLCTSQTQTWGWSLFPFLSPPPQLTAPHRKERCEGAPATLLEKGKQESSAPFVSVDRSPLPTAAVGTVFLRVL